MGLTLCFEGAGKKACAKQRQMVLRNRTWYKSRQTEAQEGERRTSCSSTLGLARPLCTLVSHVQAPELWTQFTAACQISATKLRSGPCDTGLRVKTAASRCSATISPSCSCSQKSPLHGTKKQSPLSARVKLGDEGECLGNMMCKALV